MSRTRRAWVTMKDVKQREEGDALIDAFIWRLVATLLLHGIPPHQWSRLSFDFTEEDGEHMLVISGEPV